VFDLAANAVGYGGLAFVLGASSISRETVDAWVGALPWMFLVGATFLHTTVLDVACDGASGKRTTSVAIGDRFGRLAVLLRRARWALRCCSCGECFRSAGWPSAGGIRGGRRPHQARRTGEAAACASSNAPPQSALAAGDDGLGRRDGGVERPCCSRS
jgi:hypothetical protein